MRRITTVSRQLLYSLARVRASHLQQQSAAATDQLRGVGSAQLVQSFDQHRSVRCTPALCKQGLRPRTPGLGLEMAAMEVLRS